MQWVLIGVESFSFNQGVGIGEFGAIFGRARIWVGVLLIGIARLQLRKLHSELRLEP
jgi:hypothetical protein